MDTKELMMKTTTFRSVRQRMKHLGPFTAVMDISRGYGREYLLDMFRDQGAVYLRLEEEVSSLDLFLNWLLTELGPDTEAKPLVPETAKGKITGLMFRYAAGELAQYIIRSLGETKMLLMDGLQWIRSARITEFLTYLSAALEGTVSFVLCTGTVKGEQIRREINFREWQRWSNRDLLLKKTDVCFLVDSRLPDRTEQERRELTDRIFEYLGGWPMGISYALDLLAKGGSRVTAGYLCRIQNHPMYQNYARYYLRECLTEDVVSFLRKAAELDHITKDFCNRIMGIRWAQEYLACLADKGILAGPDSQGEYRIPLIVREYLHMEEPDRTQEEREEVIGEKAYISCLGAFRLAYRGREPVWRTKKTKELFALLFASRGKPLTKDAITEALWPEWEEEKAYRLFYTTISYLRKNLEEIGLEGLFCSDRKRYSLSETWFQSDYGFLLELWKTIEQEQWEQVKKLPDIRTLYRGEFMEFCSGEWCCSIRSYAERICLQCCRQMGAHAMEEQDYEKGVQYLEFFRSIDPYSEYVASMLLRCYGQLKEYQNVKRVYQETREVCLKDLGMEPAELKEVYMKIVSSRREQSWERRLCH